MKNGLVIRTTFVLLLWNTALLCGQSSLLLSTRQYLDSALIYSKQNKVAESRSYLQLAEATANSKAMKAEVFYEIGNWYQELRYQFDSAQVYYQKACAFLHPDAPLLRLNLYRALARSCYTASLTEQGVEYCTACINLADSLKNEGIHIRCLQTLGSLMGGINNQSQKGLNYMLSALQMTKAINDTANIARAYFLVFYQYSELQQHTLANIYLDSVSMWLRIKPDTRMTSELLYRKGVTEHGLKYYAAALEYLNQALPRFYDHKDTFRIIHVYSEISGVHLDLRQYPQAIDIGQKAWALVQQKSTVFEQELIAQLLYQAYKGEGDFEQALYFAESYKHTQDSTRARNNAKTIADMETHYRATEQKKQIAEQEALLQLYFWGILAVTTLCGFILFFYLKTRQQQRTLTRQNLFIQRHEQELEHLDAAKTRFFANISHELRTPLTLILAPLTSMLKRNRLENTDFTYTKTAQTHAHVLLKLVNEILDLNKMESGKMQIKETTISFQPFIRRLVRVLKAMQSVWTFIFLWNIAQTSISVWQLTLIR